MGLGFCAADGSVESTSMRKLLFLALMAGALALNSSQSLADPMDGALSPQGPAVIGADDVAMAEPIRVAAQSRANLGGGFIEFLFSGDHGARSMPRPRYEPYPAAPEPQAPPETAARDAFPNLLFQPRAPRPVRQASLGEASQGFDPRYEKQQVAYNGPHAPGTVVIDTPNRFLYLVEPGGRALRYGVGVGRPGFSWSGVKHISAKKEWPDWIPPKEMLARRPDLPRHMEGGPNNPLGARAMYLGSSLYRIHGSNEPWTIGHAVSSGCIRMRNQDVMDLYERVNVGTKVIVM